MQTWVILSSITVLLAWSVGIVSPRFRKGALLVVALACLMPILVGRFYLPLLPLGLAVLAAGAYLKMPSKKAFSLGMVAASLLFLSVSGALVYALPEFQIPAPTGKYPVGTQSLLIDDRLPAQIWYPATAEAEKARYFLEGGPVVHEVAKLFGLPTVALAHFRWIETPASLNAPITQAEPAYPVLVFSHGLGGFKAQNSFQMVELASHGYVVLSIDHPGYAAGAIVNGETLTNQHPDLVGAQADVLDQHIGGWVANLQSALDALPEINRAFDNRLDLSRVGALGHSFGGSAAYQLLLADSRVLAAVNMDGGTFGNIQPANKPFLYMNSSSTLDFAAFSRQLDEFSDAEVLEMSGFSKDDLRQNFRELLRRRETTLQAQAYSLVIPEIQHIGFSDAVLYSPLLADRVDRHPAINEIALVFFNRFLKGEDDFPINAWAEKYLDMALQEPAINAGGRE
jgi:predicted dienelactone hydrolase